MKRTVIRSWSVVCGGGIFVASLLAADDPAPPDTVRGKSGLIAESGILPGFKQGIRVEKGERNPFGVIQVEKPEVASRGEAAKLTEILRSLPLAGLSRNADGSVRSVLLGDLRLVAGQVLPQLVDGQTDELVVQSVSEREVVVAWTKEAGRQVTDSRKLNLALDGDPKVEVILPGQRRPGTAPDAPRRSVMLTPRFPRPDASSMLPTAGVPAGAAEAEPQPSN
jgi:hypothetical protein